MLPESSFELTFNFLKKPYSRYLPGQMTSRQEKIYTNAVLTYLAGICTDEGRERLNNILVEIQYEDEDNSHLTVWVLASILTLCVSCKERREPAHGRRLQDPERNSFGQNAAFRFPCHHPGKTGCENLSADIRSHHPGFA